MNSTISFPFMNNGVWSRMFFLLFSPIQTKICLLRRKITSVFQRIAFYLENNSLKCTSPYEASYIPQSKEITTADARLKEEAAFLLDTYGNRISYNKIRHTDELDETLIAEEREDLSFVWEAIKQLPQKYREVIHLYYYEGYSTADIARILGRKESTIRSDLRRGREQLKITLKEVYDFA